MACGLASYTRSAKSPNSAGDGGWSPYRKLTVLFQHVLRAPNWMGDHGQLTGLVGIVPALGMLSPKENPPSGALHLTVPQLMAWSLALAFIGVFLAVPLRTQTIVREKLRFPSGTATANVIRTLHGLPEPPLPSSHSGLPSLWSRGRSKESGGRGSLGHGVSGLPDLRFIPEEGEPLDAEGREEEPLLREGKIEPGLLVESALSLARSDSGLNDLDLALDSRSGMEEWQQQGTRESAPEEETVKWGDAWTALLVSFAIAGVYSLIASQVSWLKTFPVFTWVGWSAATAWGWDLTPSTGYIGQGMIMGPRTAASMLCGAVAGYAVLGPMARRRGWASGAITDWKEGATGWLLWVSLAIMLGDSLTSLALLLLRSLLRSRRRRRAGQGAHAEDEDPYPASGRVPRGWWMGGLAASSIACTGILAGMLHLPAYEPLAALALAGLVALLAVRALGETDMNPVSGVGKLSQVVFALISPGRVVPNLVAGAVAEAGAQQAGDMMQDFKTAHLLGICPRSQFLAMLLGSAVSVPVSVAAYSLYTHAYEVPGPEFPAPTASIWLDMAQLVNGGELPKHVLPYCAGGAVAAALIPLAAMLLEGLAEDGPSRAARQLANSALHLLPSGISFAVGMYVAPRWTIPRVLGSVAEQIWKRVAPGSHRNLMVVIASGLVLGEGTAALITAAVKALLPH
eukprot:jgi/Botrbrau1/15800/Bobra.4_1s0150.2